MKKRIIAFCLALLMMLDYNTLGLLENVFFKVHDQVAKVFAASELSQIEPDVVLYHNRVEPKEEQEMHLHNLKEYITTRDGLYSSFYCDMGFSDGYDMITVKKMENSFKSDINEKNNLIKSAGGTDLISYVSNGGGSKNYMDATNGSVDVANTSGVTYDKMPNLLSMDSQGVFVKTINVEYFKDKDLSTIQYAFSANVSYAQSIFLKVDIINSSDGVQDKVINSKYITSYGKGVSLTGEIKVSDLGENIKIRITNMGGKASLSELKCTMTEPEAALSKVYLTKMPLPAGSQATYIEKNGDPQATLKYTPSDADDMYVVMQFDGSVKLNKMIYSDTETLEKVYQQYKYIAYGLRAYPRLALSTTDSTSVEQNSSDSTIYADYYGTMSGELNGNVSKDSCLIFKIDMSKWKARTFSIAALSEQMDRKSRTGNMEWLYKGLMPYSYYEEQEKSLKGVYPNYRRSSKEDFFKGAITDLSGNRVAVARSFPLQSVKGTDQNGKPANRVPVYDGSSPAIKEVVITSEDGKKYVKPGDYINVDVVFNCKLDETLETPKFYLNDFKNFTDLLSDSTVKNFDGTVVSDGTYSDSKMVPLNAELKVDDSNVANSFVDEGTTVTDNHKGTATMKITGTESGEDLEVYYRVFDESQIALNTNDEFDPDGWTKYSGGSVELKNLPTVIYECRNNNGVATTKRVANGGFIDICQVRVGTDENGETIYRVVKYGESDEIDTTSDSEKAMLQINDDSSVNNSVIKYKVKVASKVNVDKLCLLGGFFAVNYDASEHLAHSINYLYFNGTIKSETGKVMSSTGKNFGVFTEDENGEKTTVANGLQSSYVGVDMDSPTVKGSVNNTKEYEIGTATSKVTYTFSDKSRYQNYSLYYDISGLDKASVEVGKVNGNVEITVSNSDGVIDSKKVKNGEGYSCNNINIQTSNSSNSIPITISAKRDKDNPAVESGIDKISVPITFCVYDGAGNMTKCEKTLELPLYFASFNVRSLSEEPVVEEMYADKDKEEDGTLYKMISINKMNKEFDLKDFKLYFADPEVTEEINEISSNKNRPVTVNDLDSLCKDDNYTKDNITCFQFEDEYFNSEDYRYHFSLKGKVQKADEDSGDDGTMSYTLEDKDFEIVVRASSASGSTSGTILVYTTVPARSVFDKTLFITYKADGGVVYKASSGDEFEKTDFTMDTSDTPGYKTVVEDLGQVERVTYEGVISKDSDEFNALKDKITIAPVDGSLLANGNFKRSNKYKFDLGSTAENVCIGWSAAARFIRGDLPTYIYGTIPADVIAKGYIFDSSKIPLKYVSESLYGSIKIGGKKADEMTEEEIASAYINLGPPDDFNVFGGASWLWTYQIGFNAYTERTKVVTKYDYKIVEGKTVKTRSKDENGNELEPARTKEIDQFLFGEHYNVNILDERFVKRSAYYYDMQMNNNTSYANTYNLFLEFCPFYNSLNGYCASNDYYNYQVPYQSGRYEPVTLVLQDDVSEYMDVEKDIDFSNSYIYIYPVEKTIEGSYFGGNTEYRKAGECVRKIPLPSNFSEVKYERHKGNGDYVTCLGITADLNAYIETTSTDEDGNEITDYTLPEEGLYGAFVQIATNMTDDDGNQIMITSADHYDYEWGDDDTLDYTTCEIPLAVFGYDTKAPSGKLEFIEKQDGTKKINDKSEEAKSYLKIYNHYDSDYPVCYFDQQNRMLYKEGNDWDGDSENGYTYDCTIYQFNELSAKTVKSYKETTNPDGEEESVDANSVIECAFIDEDEIWPDMSDREKEYLSSKIRYAFVTSEWVDSYGNVKEGVEEKIADFDEYDVTDSCNKIYRAKKMFEWGEEKRVNCYTFKTNVPETDESTIYLIAKMVDYAGNESNYAVQKLYVDNEAPQAKFYTYTKDDATYARCFTASDNMSLAEDINVVESVTTVDEQTGEETTTENKTPIFEYEKTVTDLSQDKIVIEDKLGNRTTIKLSDNIIELKAPEIEKVTADESVEAEIKNYSGDAAFTGVVSEQNSIYEKTDLPEIVYENDDTVAKNNHLEFLVKPGTGNEVYAEYALSSDTYKKLNKITDESMDCSNIWTKAGIGDTVKDTGCVNVVCSESEDAEGAYKVEADILLPASEKDENYVVTFRFGNGTGIYTYYTVGYKVPAQNGEIITFKQVDNTNKQKLKFNQPLKIKDVDSAKDSQEFTLSTGFNTDKSGKYSIKYEDLLGNEGEKTVTYEGFDKSWMPDIEKTTEEDGKVIVVMDSGYKNAYGMTFENLTGDGYTITPTEDALRIVSMKEALEKDGVEVDADEKDVSVYKYAKAVVTANTSFKIKVYTGYEDGEYKTEEMTYVVDGFSDISDEYEVEYSRLLTDTDESNQYDPVTAKLIVPDGSEILSADGEMHTFYTNGTYNFKVKCPNGVIKEIPATVSCISERETDSDDKTAPVIVGVNYYLKNDEQVINVTENATEGTANESILAAPTTTSRVLAKVQALDFGENGGLNPVSISVESDNGKASLDENDPMLVEFTDNDTATVTVTDVSGNSTVQKITVKNIVEDANVTGTVRYVRCGLTRTKAYIDLAEGVTFRDLEGVQVLEKTDGTKEYYHMFTQSGNFTFKLKDSKGNIANVVTKKVNVDREPLILTESEGGRTPENPDWNQTQIVEIKANMTLEKLMLYGTDNKESDLKYYAKGDTAYIVFDRNDTVRLVATAGNGSQAEYTVSTNAIKSDSSAPQIALKKEYMAGENKYRVTATITDKMLAKYYTPKTDTTDSDNISINLNVPVTGYSESEIQAEESDDGQSIVLTKTATFYVSETSTIEVTAYNMAKLRSTESITIDVDKEAPVIAVSDFNSSVATEKTVKVSINEAGTILLNGTQEEVSADEEKSFVITKNGTYAITATDEAGNKSTKEIEIAGIDSEAPEIVVQSENISVNLDTLSGDSDDDKIAQMKAELLTHIRVTDDMSESENIDVEINIPKEIDFSKKDSYSATVQAEDEVGRVSKKTFVFSTYLVQIKEYPEIENFGANGKEFKKNGYVSFTTDTLTFTNIPKKAKVYYAKGDYTGAQMKYKSKQLTGSELTIDRKATYTVMLKLKDKSMHIYHVVNN